MAEKCPLCKTELYEVTPANRQTGAPATYRCINPECPLARNTNNRPMADLLNETVQEKGRQRGREWRRMGEQTDILCPNCGRVHLQRIGDRFRCPECGEEYASEDDLSEARRRAIPRVAKWIRKGRYKAERVGIRSKYGDKLYKYGLKRKYWDEARKAKRKHLGIPKAMKTTEAMKTNITTTNVLTAMIVVGMGVILAAVVNNLWILYGMMSVGLFVLIPAPPEYSGPPVAWGDLNIGAKFFWHSSHHGLAFLRSIAKISAIICFAMAFRNFGGIMNIPFILVCFIGYFSLKINYNRKVPGELLESLLRFGFLGAYFIPLVVFMSIFQSWVLVLVAFAFFAIPPIPSDKEGSALAVQSDFFLKMIFMVLMFAALIGSGSLAAIIPRFEGGIFGSGWALEGAMAYTFFYFWAISFIGGLFTPSDSRPVIGFVMILGATVIWGLGPGSQEVGSALLGQWWPAVHNVFTEIANPLGEVFGALGQTFGNAFLMITNPVAYAHQVMEGNYGQTGGTEKVGSFGVEISNLRVGTGMSDIFVEQPFQLMFSLKNEGGFEARDVRALVYTDLNYKRTDISKVPGILSEPDIKTGIEKVFEEKVYIGEIFGLGKAGLKGLPNNGNLERIDCEEEAGKCGKYIFHAGEGDADNNLEQQDMRSFILGGTLGCEVVDRADLREKFIPIMVEVDYNYEVGSSFQIEFLSEGEWSARAKAGTLTKRTEASKVTSAPVKLSIGSMEQPIRAGTGFFIGLELKSMEGEKSRIIHPVTVELNVPEEFITDEFKKNPCYGQARVEDGKIIWEPTKKEDGGFQENVLYCDFYPEAGRLVPDGSPSKTYYISANATYRFSKWEKKDAKLAFGSWCCGNKDCEKIGKVCVPSKAGELKGNCQEKVAVPEPEKECGELTESECDYRTDCGWRDNVVNPKTGKLGYCIEV